MLPEGSLIRVAGMELKLKTTKNCGRILVVTCLFINIYYASTADLTKIESVNSLGHSDDINK